MTWARRFTMLVLVLGSASLVSWPLAAVGAEQERAEPDASAQGDSAGALRRDLRTLAAAWRDGGGTYGYPFWEKAQVRWRAGEISSTVFREYVTGYRDRLGVGCELLEGTELRTETGGEVRELLVEACQERREGLRDQRLWLDGLIRRSAEMLDAEARSELDAEIAEREADTRERFQASWRGTRLAMDLAQSALDGAALDRLHEDAFI